MNRFSVFLVFLATSAGLTALAEPANRARGAERPDLRASQLAHWSFDETGGDVLHDASGRANLDIQVTVPRAHGVFGQAVELAGRHQLKVAPVAPAGLQAISFSAWVKPTDLSGYREIFRQECPERLLFSFQNSGTILSLGLNVGGYVECDARIEPGEVLDGAWHHCAATFDGQEMRVYLDARLIGRLQRRGPITINTKVPAFVGSSSGAGEHFQGTLDELRVVAAALTQAEIDGLYRAGVASVAARYADLEAQVRATYKAEKTFAATLSALGEFLSGKQGSTDREFVGAMLARLRADFPDDYEQFVRITGSAPAAYLRAESHDARVKLCGKLVDLMREYEPLTADQWRRQTPDQRRHWEEVERIAAEFRLLRDADRTATGADWIELMLEAGRRVKFRPSVSEAVAPYRPAETPVTRDLSPAQAVDTLHQDWLHQAGGKPTMSRIKAEIEWARQLADRIRAQADPPVDFSGEMKMLDRLAAEVTNATDPDQALYFRVREVKRQIAFKNPAVDFDQVLFVDMPLPQGSEWAHQTRHRLGYMAVPGGRLLVLDGLSPAGHLRQLMPQPPLHGSFWRPDLSFDGRRVLACFKPHNEKSFHLYEVNIDGSALRQLTEGPYDDLDPIYLPDDHHLLFSTTRGHTYVRCMPPTNAFVLARCNMDGEGIYLVSRNSEPDYLPSVMDNGRVIYTRWEYTDKPLWRAQALWTVNPDGTHVSTFWGNQSVWPDLLKDARSIPGSRRVMFTGSAHHNWFAGSVGIIDPAQGFNFPNGLTKVTADVSWPESGNGPVDPIESPHYHASGKYSAYYSPFPLNEHDFLVSANRNGHFVLYLMDVDGNRELIYAGVHHILHALPVRRRHKPPVIVDRVAWPARSGKEHPQAGVIFSENVYEGVAKELRGKAKYLRVLNVEPKTYTYWYKRPYLSTGPVVSAVQSEGVKRVLGTVPIEADGSVAFYAPSGVALHFQILDHRYRALQTMRSFTGVMPGEHRGCLGCHESHSTAPTYRSRATALTKEPQTITPPPWGKQSVSYARFVRPALDQYCAKCHEGSGEAVKTLDLTARPGFLIFDEPYMVLTGRPSWGVAYKQPARQAPGFGIANMLMVEGYEKTDPVAYRTPQPMTRLSYKSHLIELVSGGEHYGVRVDPLTLRKLIAWIDTMCPYRGHQEVCEIDDPDFQGVDWLSIRPRIKSAPTIVRPGPVD